MSVSTSVRVAVGTEPTSEEAFAFARDHHNFLLAGLGVAAVWVIAVTLWPGCGCRRWEMRWSQVLEPVRPIGTTDGTAEALEGLRSGDREAAVRVISELLMVAVGFSGRRRQPPPGPAGRQERTGRSAPATRYFVRPEYDSVIFSEEVRAEPADDGDRRVDEAGYLWCRCYSTRCVDGEMGHVHPDTAIELTHDEFALARVGRWRAGSSSRHTFDTEPEVAYWQVGWDQPTTTFFAQCYRVGDEDQPRMWIGLGYREFLSVGSLQEAMGTPIPDVRTRLTLDQEDGSFDVETGRVLDL
jgi:hypothetical protein